MDIISKLAKKAQNNWEEPSVTIAFLGDSVTQGCFEVYKTSEKGIQTVFDKNSAYHAYIARILAVLYPTVPVNIINGGISGGSAPHGLARLERDILIHHPDLTVVCFGLNDSGKGQDGLVDYLTALEQIFIKLEESGSEIIFMTPNMMATEVSCHIKDDHIKKIASEISKRQTEGGLDQYIEGAKDLCKARGITVCDCYAKWKILAESGVNITELLSNKINHPTRDMNYLFAVSLVETMFS